MRDDDPYLTLRERVMTGEAAQRLLSDPVLDAVFKQIETDAIEQWRTAFGATGLQTRERAHALLQGADAVRNQLRVLFDDGEIARGQLAEAELTEQGDED